MDTKPADSKRLASPIFLVGAERSGTTLLRLMFNHHPKITWVNEFEYAVDMMDDPSAWPAVEDYAAWLDQHRVFRATGLELDRSLSYADAVNDFLVQWKRRADRPIIGATVHRHFDRIPRIWPDARFIHLVRDARDVSRSRVELGWWEGDYYHAALIWLETEKLWDRFRDTLPPQRWTQLRYEDLVAEPVEHLRRVCALIGADYDPAMLEYHRDTTYGPVDPKLSYQWKRKLSGHDIRLVEAAAGEMMKRRGYEMSGRPELKVTPRLLFKQDMINRWRRWRFRVKRYGLRLWLADWFSRRVGGASWQRKVRLAMNTVDESYLK